MGEIRDDVAGRALRGAATTIASGLILVAIQAVNVVVVGRLISPRDFGLVTVVTTFSTLLMNCGINGFTEVLVQRAEWEDGFASDIFWLNAGIGTALSVAFVLVSNFIASVWAEPVLGRIGWAMSVTIAATSISVVPLALLKRRLAFAVLSINDIRARLIGAAVAVSLAWNGLGVWSLVASAVVVSLSLALGAWRACDWQPNRGPSWNESMGPAIRFAAMTYGRFALNYFIRNVDNVLVGSSFGAETLGQYKKAYDLFALSVAHITAPLSSVAVPSLCRVAGDRERYAAYIMEAVSLIALGGLGLAGLLTLSGSNLLYVLLGAGWADAGRVFTMMGPGTGALLIYGMHGWIHVSLGHPERWLRWTLIELVVTTGLIMASLPWGAAAVGAAWSASCWLLLTPSLWYAGRPAQVPLGPTFGRIGRCTAAAAASFVIVVCLVPSGYRDAKSTGEALSFTAVLSIAFLVVYVTNVIILDRGAGAFRNVKRLILRHILPAQVVTKFSGRSL